MVMIAPSLLSADFGNLSAEMQRCEAAGADLYHVDVMDGHFAPNITLGVPVVDGIRRCTKLPLDVHLMITNPERYAEAFCKAGAEEMGVKTGIAISPDTSAKSAMQLAAMVDLVLVMSVHPGFSGQSFIPGVLEKIGPLRGAMREGAVIEMDGGMNAETAPRAREAGVDILVAGSAVFGADDMAAAIRELRG